MQILDDIQGLGLKDIFDTYAFINQQKINQGLSKSQSTIAELNAQTELFRAKAMAATNSIGAVVKDNKLVTIAVLVGLGLVAYKLLK